jgi:hypothetical protein
LWRHSRNAWRGGGALISREPSARGAGEAGGLWLLQKSTLSCQSPECVLSLFSRRRGEYQVSNSVETAPHAEFLAQPFGGLSGALPASLAAMSGASLQPVERAVTLRRAGDKPARLPAPPFVRPEMAPQAIEKPRFAPENGARSCRDGEAAPGRPFAFMALSAVRLEMPPQTLENAQNAPGNGARRRPRFAARPSPTYISVALTVLGD